MIEVELRDGEMYIDGRKQDMNGTLSFQEFEAIYAAIKILIRITSDLFDISESMEQIPKGLYTEIIRLHNAAVDYIEAYNDLTKEEK